MKQKDQVVEFYNTLYSTTVRRYPEYDVAAFAARLASPCISMDLGTGTGRNLLPLLQASANHGLVVATDMSDVGVQQVCHWATAVGGSCCAWDDLDETVRLTIERTMPDPRSFTVHKIGRLDHAAKLGPNAVFKGEANPVYLLTGVANMAAPLAKDGSVDAIVNRGSIFYLSEAEIASCMDNMRRALKPGGQLLLTLKSTLDSRYVDGVPVSRDGYRRQVQDVQKGLEMQFYDEARVRELARDWEIVSISHLMTQYLSKGMTLADWSIVLKRSR
jgi:SAM-dependent methyltransferase